MEEPVRRTRSRHRRCAGERGQILPLIALLMVAAAALVLAVAGLGREVVARARATTAADASALAAATSGAAAADAIARANGADLVDVDRLEGGDVRVRIERDGVAATARARLRRSTAGGGDAGAAGPAGGLAPAMRAAIRRAEGILGRPIPITSGYRSPTTQQRLWDRRTTNRYPVATPGTSRHEQGLAIDVPAAFVPTLASVAADAGLCQPLPRADPVHFELCGAGFTPRVRG